MKSLKTKKRGVDKPFLIAAGFVALLLSIPLTLYVLQQQQLLKQHAQMTPPPAPPGCYYIPTTCSDPNIPCDPGDSQLVCTYTLTPSVTPANSQGTAQNENVFSAFLNWIKNLF